MSRDWMDMVLVGSWVSAWGAIIYFIPAIGV